MHGHVQLAGNGVQPVHLPKVFGGDAAVQLHVHPPRPQKAHCGKGLFKAAGAAAQGLVGGVVGPIEGDVHPPGLVAGKKVRPFFIQKGAVGVQGEHQALGLQGQIQLLKSGHQQRLAAGEQQKQHPRPGHGAGQLGPLLAGAQGARSPGLPGRKAHIAHTAVHIAQGGQLQTAADGAAQGRGPGDELALQRGGGGVFHERQRPRAARKRVKSEKGPDVSGPFGVCIELGMVGAVVNCLCKTVMGVITATVHIVGNPGGILSTIRLHSRINPDIRGI